VTVTLEPIGFVETDARDLPRHWSVSDVRGRLVFQERYAQGLKDIQPGERIVVLFQFHQSPPFTPDLMLQVPPTRDEARGVFSTCAPIRSGSRWSRSSKTTAPRSTSAESTCATEPRSWTSNRTRGSPAS